METHLLAAAIRRRNATNAPEHIAEFDQTAATIRDVWAERGVDVTDPTVARTVFSTLRWAFAHYVDTLATDDPAALRCYGERLIATISVIAEFIPPA